MNLAPPVRSVKTDYQEIREVKETLVVLDPLVLLVLEGLLVLLVALDFLVPRVIQAYPEHLDLKENLE